MGVLYRGTNTTVLKINLKDNDSTELYIIVENMGRLNFGDDLLDLSYLTSNWIPNFQMNNTPNDHLMGHVNEAIKNSKRMKTSKTSTL